MVRSVGRQVETQRWDSPCGSPRHGQIATTAGAVWDENWTKAHDSGGPPGSDMLFSWCRAVDFSLLLLDSTRVLDGTDL